VLPYLLNKINLFVTIKTIQWFTDMFWYSSVMDIYHNIILFILLIYNIYYCY